jgi:hypothetical protein
MAGATSARPSPALPSFLLAIRCNRGTLPIIEGNEWISAAIRSDPRVSEPLPAWRIVAVRSRFLDQEKPCCHKT